MLAVAVALAGLVVAYALWGIAATSRRAYAARHGAAAARVQESSASTRSTTGPDRRPAAASRRRGSAVGRPVSAAAGRRGGPGAGLPAGCSLRAVGLVRSYACTSRSASGALGVWFEARASDDEPGCTAGPRTLLWLVPLGGALIVSAPAARAGAPRTLACRGARPPDGDLASSPERFDPGGRRAVPAAHPGSPTSASRYHVGLDGLSLALVGAGRVRACRGALGLRPLGRQRAAAATWRCCCCSVGADAALLGPRPGAVLRRLRGDADPARAS